MFNRNKTKWIPLGNFNWNRVDYVVFVRGDKKTGMLDFKTKSVNARSLFSFDLVNPIIKTEVIDVNAQWSLILQMTNN
jgi:hypothetical protein